MIDVDDPLWDLMAGVRRPERKALDCDKLGASAACEYCSGSTIHLIDGNWTCAGCHSVIGRFIDSSAEWRYYGADDARGTDPTRCCPPSNDLLPTLGCIVGKTRTQHSSHNGGSGANGTDDKNRLVQRYQMWNSLTYRQRTLCGVFDLLSANAAQFGLPSCILEEAKTLYKKVSDAKISRGENRHALIASSLYMACKSNKVPRSIKEIAAMFDIRVSAMTKGCRLFQQIMHMDLNSSSPVDFVARFCSKLCMSPPHTALTKHVIERTDELAIVCESTPPSVVAGAIHMVSQELGLNINKKDIGDACMISPVTICKCYKRMLPFREQLLPEDVHAFLRTHN
jgi:transcription initiation factor TFIIB